jgi:hypothetical protein
MSSLDFWEKSKFKIEGNNQELKKQNFKLFFSPEYSTANSKES